MRRATDFEHLDDDGETDAGEQRALKARELAGRRQLLVDSMRDVQLRYSRLSHALTDLAQRYDVTRGNGEGA